ncbi:MAG: C40 family peptidase, partial [Acidobacteria bacterium]|nr:C40 family peptidase [Acidobacteriota bacterium]
QLAASEVDARLAGEAAALATYRSRLAQTGHAVRDIAVTEFMKGGQRSHPVIAVLDQNDPQGVVLARLLAGIAVSRTQDALDASKAAQQDLQAHMRTLRLEHRRAHAATASLEAARRSAQSAVAQQQAHLGQVRGALLGLVRAEQARRQAALEARTRAMMRRHLRSPRPRIAASRARGRSFSTSAHPVDASRASRAVAEARRMLGKRYQWAAAGPNRFDCSGLTMWAWRAAGVALAHYSGAQYGATVHIPLDELRPGDLVFFHRRISHVGIYVGGGRMIHAPRTGDVVRYASIFSDGAPIYAGRVVR